MAFCAAVHSHMGTMAESYISCAFDRVRYFPHGVAFCTIFQGKCPFAVMAGTARFPLLHVSHACLGVRAGVEYPAVADGALHGLQMPCVTELDRAGFLDLVGDLADFVAMDTVSQGKSRGTVVAGAAGFPLFHVSHCEPSIFVFFADMAGLAAEIGGCPAFFLQVDLVTENHGAGILGGVRNILQFHGRNHGNRG